MATVKIKSGNNTIAFSAIPAFAVFFDEAADLNPIMLIKVPARLAANAIMLMGIVTRK